MSESPNTLAQFLNVLDLVVVRGGLLLLTILGFARLIRDDFARLRRPARRRSAGKVAKSLQTDRPTST